MHTTLRQMLPACFSPLRLRLMGLTVLASLAACATPPDTPQPAPTQASAETPATPPVAVPVQAPTGLPAPVLEALVQTGLPESALSVWVQPVTATSPSLHYRSEEPRLMASVMKLITTGTALQLLGPQFTWQTDAALVGTLDAQGVLQGDVRIRASGDPSLDAARLGSWMQQWRLAGLRDIRGKLVVDESLFELPPHDPASFDGEGLKPYNAGPRPWLLAHGAVSLQLQADAARPGWARTSLFPPLAGVTLQGQVKLTDGPCGDWRSGIRLDIQTPPENPVVAVAGTYPRSCGAQAWPLLWPEATPGDHANRVWAAAWAASGGVWRGNPARDVVRDAWPSPPPAIWSSWTSPPLSEVIRDINKFSNNVMARELFLTLGRLMPDGQWRETVNLAQARGVIHRHVEERTHKIDPQACTGDALVLDNGAGLSRREGASARCMGAWLMTLWQDPLMPEWLASLPIAGIDGTARRMQAVQGQAHLKTGSLDNVMAAAGVVDGAGGGRAIVVAVINHPQAEQGKPVMRALMDWVRESH